MSKKRLDEYNKKYGHIPKNFSERFIHLLDELKIKQSELPLLKQSVKKALRVEYERISFVFYFVPQATPRARYSRFTKAFYVKNALDYNKLFGEFVESNEFIDFKISTPCEFTCITYSPMPEGMNKIEKLLAELSLIKCISKPDWDNLGKTYSDMVQKHLLIDDCLIYKGTTEKYYSTRPRIEITIDYMVEHDSKYNRNKVKKWKSYNE